MKNDFFRNSTVLFTFLLCLSAFVGCGRAGGSPSQSSAEETSGEISFLGKDSSVTASHEWKNYSGVSVMSGNHTVNPLSGLSYSCFETQEGDEVMEWNACGEGAYSILQDPLETFPTLIRYGDVSVTVPANGTVRRLETVDMEDPNRSRTATTLEALSEFPAGEYCIVLTVLLSGNCDPDALQSETCYEDVFRLVVYEDESDLSGTGVLFTTYLYVDYVDSQGLVASNNALDGVYIRCGNADQRFDVFDTVRVVCYDSMIRPQRGWVSIAANYGSGFEYVIPKAENIRLSDPSSGEPLYG